MLEPYRDPKTGRFVKRPWYLGWEAPVGIGCAFLVIAILAFCFVGNMLK